MFENISISIKKIVCGPKSWRPGRLAKGTIVMTMGMGIRTIGQGIVFLIIARILGVEAFGGYAAVLALAMVFGGFVGLGSSVLMLRETARDVMSFKESWGHTIAAYILSAPLILFIFYLAAWYVLPKQIAWMVVLCLGIAEILFAPLTLISIQTYQGHERIGRASRLVLAQIIPRLMAASFMLFLPIKSPQQKECLSLWAVFYLIATASSAIYSIRLLRRDIGLTVHPNWHGLGHVLRQSYAFSISGPAQKINADIDKVLLSQLATLEITGGYSAAYRMMDMVSVPLVSFFSAASARFFRAGQDGMGSAAWYVLRVLPLPMLYAVAVGTALFGLAGLLPWLLGTGFAPAVGALRWLAWLPLLSTPRRFIQFAFNASGRQSTTVLVIVCGAALNIALNLWAIPVWGWQGAVGAAYAAELAMNALFLTSATRNWNKWLQSV